MSAMALWLDVLRWTATAVAVVAVVLALLLWWRRPREVVAKHWDAYDYMRLPWPS